MRLNRLSAIMAIGLVIIIAHCGTQLPVTKTEPARQTAAPNVDPLPSWNESSVKQQLIAYCTDSVQKIPAEHRVAVFDMDGTIACEEPLWMEMYAAVYGLNLQSAEDTALLANPEYRFAQKLAVNPFDTSVQNNWGPYINSMVWKAYAGFDNQVYIDTARSYLSETGSKDSRPDLAAKKLIDLFYQPMLELIALLKNKSFDVYIVSGSIEGVIWAVAPRTIMFDRAHLIGTVQASAPLYDPSNHLVTFVLQDSIVPPSNNNNGKSLNIYNRIGKTPVFAFGNTDGDFGMMHFASTSEYPHMALLLNHDDSVREYAYPPYHGKPVPAWQDTMNINQWITVNMAADFKTVWMKRK
jgi:phosphoglycolate phosphatase-like HAD superfamily hydrolase